MTGRHVKGQKKAHKHHDYKAFYHDRTSLSTDFASRGRKTLDFANRLKLLRKSAGMTQAKLAELASMDPSAIAHLEGDRRKPSFHNIRKLAKALNISTDVLLNHDGPIVAFRNVQDLKPEDRETVQSIINTLANKP